MKKEATGVFEEATGVMLMAFILLCFFLISNATATTEISVCSVLDVDGETYLLTQDITNNGSSKCIDITANNITFDGQGHTIDGTDTASTYGAYSNCINTVIHSCTVTDWAYGINLASGADSSKVYNITSDSNAVVNMRFYADNLHIYEFTTKNTGNEEIILDDTSNSIIENGTMQDGLDGFYLYGTNVKDNIFRNITVQNMTDYGINVVGFGSGDSNNSFYNNIFNFSSIELPSGYIAKWNTTKQAGDNIYDSNNPYIGGNYWTNSSGTGYSNTYLDQDGDGFCDYPYPLRGGFDYLMLSDEYGNAVTPRMSEFYYAHDTIPSPTSPGTKITDNENATYILTNEDTYYVVDLSTLDSSQGGHDSIVIKYQYDSSNYVSPSFNFSFGGYGEDDSDYNVVISVWDYTASEWSEELNESIQSDSDKYASFAGTDYNSSDTVWIWIKAEHKVVCPVLSSIARNDDGETTADVTWTTDIDSYSIVAYDTSSHANWADYGNYDNDDDCNPCVTSTTNGSEWTSSHAIHLTGLSGTTDYHYRVKSCSDSNHEICNTSAEYSFTTGSCPFIYSWNGSEWFFDHEAFPYAVTKAGETTSSERLEHLKPVDGILKLQIREELTEISWTDFVNVYSVEHPNGDSFIMTDLKGNPHTIQNQIVPNSCIDKDGNDCLDLISAFDDKFWASSLDKDFDNPDNHFDWVVLEFEKPEGTKDVKIGFEMVKGYAITWGWQHLINEVGKNNFPLMEWAVTNLPFLYDQWIWTLHTNWRTSIEIWDGNEWKLYDTIESGRERWTEFLVYEDISDIKTDTLKIRLRATTGFYEYNHVFVDYSKDEEMVVTNLEMLYAVKTNTEDVNENVREQLLYQDENYVELTDITRDTVDMEFRDVSTNPDWKREYFVKARGFYHFRQYTEHQSFVHFLKTFKDILIPFLYEEGFEAEYFVANYAKTQHYTSTPPTRHCLNTDFVNLSVSEYTPSTTLEAGNNIAITNDWGQANNSNISVTVSGSTASEVNVTYNDTRLTNATDWGDKAVGVHWDNQSVSHGSTVGNVYVQVMANTTSSGGTNDTEYFWLNTTKRTNTGTMDSAATQSVNTDDDFFINATCVEEYADTFYGAADLLEDGVIVLTDATVTDYVNFAHNESSVGQYNYTVRFYNTTYYDNATTPTFSNVTVSVGGTTPSISNVNDALINSSAQWVSWAVNQSSSNRVKHSLYSNMSSESWSGWENTTATPNITLSNLSAVKHYYQAWSYNSTDEGLTDNSTTANFTVDATPPTITAMARTPSSVLIGTPVTITCTVTDDVSGVKNVSVQIKDAKDRVVKYTMVAGASNAFSYTFSYTGKEGWYYIQYFSSYDNASNLKEEISTLSFSAVGSSAGGGAGGGGGGGEVPTPSPTPTPEINVTVTQSPASYWEEIHRSSVITVREAVRGMGIGVGIIVGVVFIAALLITLWNIYLKGRRENDWNK